MVFRTSMWYVLSNTVFYSSLVVGFFFFFFFQAEDGIRDGTVTGVQTCALPISSVPGHGRANNWLVIAIGNQTRGARDGSGTTKDKRLVSHQNLSPGIGGSPYLFRSEERRVGKSVDLGGRRIIKKKKKRKRTAAN